MLVQVESAVATESGKREAEELCGVTTRGLNTDIVRPLCCLTVLRTVGQPAGGDDGEDEG